MPNRFYVKAVKGSGTQDDVLTVKYWYRSQLNASKFGFTTQRAASRAMEQGVSLLGSQIWNWSVETETF